MNTKIFSPKQHGINDYAFAALQFLVPPLMGFNKKAIKLYQVLGTGSLAYNALTDTPVGLKPVITYDVHQKIDLANAATMAVVTFLPAIRKDKKALIGHIGFLALAAANILLTDWDAAPQDEETSYQ